MLAWIMARADFRVPTWKVVLFIVAESDFCFSAVEGAVSLEDFSWVVEVGSRMGREEVEGSCSWVAI